MRKLIFFTLILASSASFSNFTSGSDSLSKRDFCSAGIPKANHESMDSLYEDIPQYDKKLISRECDMYLDNRTLISDVEFSILNDSTLLARKDEKAFTVKISDVRKLVYKPVAPFGNGYLIGSGIGFLAVFLPSLFIKPRAGEWGGPGIGALAGLILSVPCGLVGGVVGLLTTSNDSYLFDKGTKPAKFKRLHYLIKKYEK